MAGLPTLRRLSASTQRATGVEASKGLVSTTGHTCHAGLRNSGLSHVRVRDSVCGPTYEGASARQGSRAIGRGNSDRRGEAVDRH